MIHILDHYAIRCSDIRWILVDPSASGQMNESSSFPYGGETTTFRNRIFVFPLQYLPACDVVVHKSLDFSNFR